MRKISVIIPIIVTAVAVSGLYYYSSTVASKAAADAVNSFKLVGYEVRGFSLNPLDGVIAATCKVQNPSDVPLRISMSLDFYLGSVYVAELKAYDESIDAGGQSTIEMLAELDERALKIYAEGGLTGSPRLTGVVKVDSTVLIFPMSVGKSLDLVTMTKP